MAKKENDLAPIIIPEHERLPELETKVEYYLSTTYALPENKVKPQRTKPIESKDPVERDIWEREEIRRIREGHFGMSGKFYFWYNFCKIWDIENGMIRPEFRFAQNEFFRHIEEQQLSKEWGVICVKRRRVGASWMIAADVLHDCLTSPFFKAGMTSKTKEDAEELFRKILFIYDNLPEFLQAEIYSRTVGSIEFARKGPKKQKSGLQSEVRVKAPTETSWEGFAIRKLVIDEMGKVPNAKAIYSMGNETMRVGTRRVGTPVLFGTSGDITKEGKDLMEMWYNADIYKLKPFFFAGYMGLIVDEFGNDLREHAIRWIIYERKRLETLSHKELVAFIQQYPLTVQEAFTSSEEGGLGNKVKIQKQRDFLLTTPIPAKKGYFKPNANEDPIWVPDVRGACVMYEDREDFKNLYLGGSDPTDHKSENKRLSSLSLILMSKPNGLQPPKIVFKYTDRPADPRDFYDQALMALRYYNNSKVLIERNKYGMISYFEERGFKHLLAGEPQGVKKYVPKAQTQPGYYKTQYSTAYGEELIEQYVEDYCDLIPALSLLDQFDNYGIQNTDEVDAFMAVLMYLKDDKEKVRKAEEIKSNIPNFEYRFNGSGQIKLVKKTKPNHQ
jgi:hypothetical protein